MTEYRPEVFGQSSRSCVACDRAPDSLIPHREARLPIQHTHRGEPIHTARYLKIARARQLWRIVRHRENEYECYYSRLRIAC